ncbi:hypothetical protein [Cyanobium sp. LEGE 06113]|uniref:hypothetical protein n=1 Tax=Cyanobium sp. LEGE 06113 TaxID=1297573 RepID=UPI001D145A07|nr:hypothetical protein [Cyanobium sp. LEGE 06113]
MHGPTALRHQPLLGLAATLLVAIAFSSAAPLAGLGATARAADGARAAAILRIVLEQTASEQLGG